MIKKIIIRVHDSYVKRLISHIKMKGVTIMPWTMNDYPSSLKSLSKTTRKKAIDIANALIDEGYREENAIPIATTQAKEWYDNASQEERDDYLQNGEPTKRQSNQHSRPELLDKPEMVVPHEEGWAVKSKDAKKPAKVFSNKSAAIDYGKSVAKNKQTRLIIHKQDGSKQKDIQYG